MQELQTYFNLRANIYHLLGKGFYKEASQEYLENLNRHMSVLKTMAENHEVQELLEGVKLYDSFYGETDESTPGELARLFALIFLSTGLAEGIKSITPHESVYLSRTGLIMQEQRDEVLEIYRRSSVQKDQKFKEPEDHITPEMDFMAFLSQRAACWIEEDNSEELEKNISLQKDFLTAHLEKWVPVMCSQLFKASGNKYYQALATLTPGYLKADKIFLEAMLETV